MPCCWAPWAGPNGATRAPPVRPEQGLLGMRKELGLFANLRPVQVLPALAGASPLRPESGARGGPGRSCAS